MPKPTARKPSDQKRLAWIMGILCAVCCAAPLVVVAFVGSAGLAALSMYSEMAVGVVLLLGIGFLLYKRFIRRKVPACETGCGCKPASKN